MINVKARCCDHPKHSGALLFELVKPPVEVELPGVKLDDLIVPVRQAELVKVQFELVELFE